MMDTLGVSRPTIREAVRVAESLGLVATRHADSAGPTVLRQPSAGVARILDGLLPAERMSVAELLEAKRMEQANEALGEGKYDQQIPARKSTGCRPGRKTARRQNAGHKRKGRGPAAKP